MTRIMSLRRFAREAAGVAEPTMLTHNDKLLGTFYPQSVATPMVQKVRTLEEAVAPARVENVMAEVRENVALDLSKRVAPAAGFGHSRPAPKGGRK